MGSPGAPHMADITPATGSAIGLVAGVVLEVLGVDVPPLVWSTVGAALMQGYSQDTVSRGRAMVQVIASALLGSLIGLTITKVADISHQHTTYLLCALGGFGAHPLMQLLLSKLTQRIEGGGK